MAKAVPAKELSAKMPSGIAAARILEAKLQEMEAFAEPALAGDVDGIHDLRVAAKRLREALRLFRPVLPKRRGRELTALVDRLNDSLGAVRDRDVLAGHAQTIREQAPEAETFIARLLEVWAEERAARLAEFADGWGEPGDTIPIRERREVKPGDTIPIRRRRGLGHVPERLGELVADTRKRRGPANELPLDRFAYLAVGVRLQRVKSHLDEGGPQDAPAVLHRLRILVKRLKYAIEPFLPALPALEGPYGPVANVQESLGLVHDYDVLHAEMSEFARRRLKGGRAALDRVAEQRSALHEAARGQIEIIRSEAWQRSLLDGLD
jgi:CHAD domain-containing protein